MSNTIKKVLIIGGGFGGLYAAKKICEDNFQVTLLDKRNFHLFQPLLYQVATGILASGNIASPLRRILKKKKNITIFQEEALDLDPTAKTVTTDGGIHAYDYLIVATGVRDSYFGHDEWEPYAPPLKTVEDAIEIRRRVLFAFEAAERETDPKKQAAWLTFVIIGGGPTGVELAGALAELAHGTLKGEYKNINPADARILLIDRGERILKTYSERSSNKAEKTLKKMGVSVLTDTGATHISESTVTLLSKHESRIIETHTALWAAGVKASHFSKAIQARTDASVDGAGRVLVQKDCSIPGWPEIFAIGDVSFFDKGDGTGLPGVAPVAMQQGAYVSKIICSGISKESREPFRYRDQGSLAVIGKNKAVYEWGSFRCSGFFAWIIWAFIHIFYLIEFENKFSVITQWAWTYFTHGRGSRLVMEKRILRMEQGKNAHTSKQEGVLGRDKGEQSKQLDKASPYH